MGKKRIITNQGDTPEADKANVGVTKKSVKRQVFKGTVYVFSSYNNTIVSVADPSGNVFAFSSAGTMGFKGARKSTPYAATLVGKDAVEKAERAFGRIDVLVNNAGYGYLAAVEEGEDREVRAMFDANFFGLIDMTKQVLPGMRARRHGHIVNISSVGGLVAGATAGYYNATKFAVEGLSEALAKEVEPLGIRVTLIEPGPFRTDWAGRSLKQTATPLEDYTGTAGARRALIAGNSGKQPGDPARAAAAIMSVVESPSPPLRVLLGRPALELARAKLGAMTDSIAQWEALTLGADFPQHD